MRMPSSLPVHRGRAHLIAAAVTAVALAVVGVSPAVADPVVVAQTSGPTWDVTLSRSGPGTLEARITNRAAESHTFGLGASLSGPDTISPLWKVTWGAFAQQARADIGGGESNEFAFPLRPGVQYVVYRDVDAAQPEAVLSYRTPGRFAPLDIRGTDDQPVVQFGNPITVNPAVTRAGDAPRITVGGLDSVTAAEVWLVPDERMVGDFGLGDAPLTLGVAGGERIGTLPVAGGRVDGTVPIPAGRAPGRYVLLVGDSTDGWWPGGPALRLGDDTDGDGSADGTFSNLTIEAGPPLGGTVRSDVPVEVKPLDQFGNQPVSFTFPGVSEAGTTTVTTSTTGPTPTGFRVLTAAPSYYQLETSAVPTGPVTVCIAFPISGLTSAEASGQSLFHFIDGAWVDITTLQESGRVCGETQSFSPFAVGRKIQGWPFSGFLAPVVNDRVNAEFAGTIIPFRFRVGGDRGLKILAGGSPSSGAIATCRIATAPASTTAAASALPVPLVYVKATKTYWFLWKTDRAWAGTCRQFTLTLTDGTTHRATFRFVKLPSGGVLRPAPVPS